MMQRLVLHALWNLFYGVLAHDYIHQVWQLKGTFLSLEGGYIGLAGVYILYVLLTRRDFIAAARQLS